MNKYLYKASLKNTKNTLLIYISSIITYILTLLFIFPSMSKNSDMSDMIKSLPKALLTTFGINGSLGDLNDFLNMNFFNSIYIYILIAYCILITAKLVTKPVERTSMAYLLSTSVSRTNVIITQLGVFITGLIAICGGTYLTTIVGFKLILRDYKFDLEAFTRLNLITFAMFVFVGSICFLVAVYFNTEEMALAWSATIVVGSYAIDIVRKLSEQLDFLKYSSIFTLFKPDKIGTTFAAVFKLSGVLILFGIIIMYSSILIFKKKDLLL